MDNKFYLTAAIPYVNAKPHIGHALEFVQADVVVRYHRQILKHETLLLSGGDENALKNVQAAEKARIPVEEFVDKNTQSFYDLTKKLNCHFDIWQKGYDKKHFQSTQELWQRCLKSGDIYKKSYQGLYCLGCEAFYTKEELNEKGECFEHPGKKVDQITEENYFFRLSKYQDDLSRIISRDELKIIPKIRKNEVLSFLKQPLQDISVSRSNARARNWGVPVPNDSTQRIYVWFDALNIYQSGVGFGWDEKTYQKWWPADLHIIGKGITRFHAVYWPAFLMSAGLKPPKSIFVHGYLTINGQKMSKTLGNIIDPLDIIGKYGAEALRYYLLREIPSYGDGDYSERRFKELYNADLAGGLGNAVSRVAKLCETGNHSFTNEENSVFEKEIKERIEEYRFDHALGLIWATVDLINKTLNEDAPWNLKGERQKNALEKQVVRLRQIGFRLQPFLPETSAKISKQFAGPKIKLESPLFPRIS